jgi:hypothetical protein
LSNSGAVSVDRAELVSLHRAARAFADRLAALLDEEPAKPGWLSTAQAAEIGHVGSQQTIRNWCRRYAIGICVRGVDSKLVLPLH